MKKILFFLLWIVCLTGQAQTFPVNNLQVNGTANVNGATTTSGLISNSGSNSFIGGAISNASVAATSLSASVNNPSLNYLSNGTNAVARSYASVFGDRVSVKDFGAKGDGVTDDTAAIQAAINYAETFTIPGAVYFPNGIYVISSALNVTAGITMYGDSLQAPQIRPASTIQAITVSTSSAFTLRGLYINYTTAQSSGLYAITVTASSGSNAFSTFRDVWISGAYNDINLQESSFFLVDRCFFENFSGSALNVSDAQNIDVGDSTVINSTFFNFSTYVGTGTAITYQSAGGLRVINNKFGATLNGVYFNYATDSGSVTPNTAQLLITGNSFDTMTGNAVALLRQTNTDIFNSVVISNNVFPDCFSSINIPLDVNGNWLDHVTITGNVIVTPATASAVGITLNSITNFAVTGNSLQNNSTTGTGITIGSTATSGMVALNNLASPAVAWQNAIFTASSSVSIMNNLGFNPLGQSYLSPGASPWTYTNGAEPREVFLSASTGLTSVQTGGNNTLPASAGANVPFTIELSPFQSIVITYTGTLSATSYTH